MLLFQFNEDKNKKITYEYAIENIMKNYEIHFPTIAPAQVRSTSVIIVKRMVPFPPDASS